MIYQLGDIRIRPFTPEDMTEEYFIWFHDQETTRYNSHGLFPYGKKLQEDFKRELEDPINRIVWAIEVQTIQPEQTRKIITTVGERTTSYQEQSHTYWKLVGNCSLQSINWHNRSAEFAIVIGEKGARGKGVGTKVLSMVLDHAFYKLGLNRVWTGTAATNLGMQAVAIKTGMKLEGEFREGMFLNGKFENIRCYGILSREHLLSKEKAS